MLVELDDDAALIIFDMISRMDDNIILLKDVVEDAEMKSLWALQCELEKKLVAVIDPGYKLILEAAKDRIRSKL